MRIPACSYSPAAAVAREGFRELDDLLPAQAQWNRGVHIIHGARDIESLLDG
jgi:hypothetical protein